MIQTSQPCLVPHLTKQPRARRQIVQAVDGQPGQQRRFVRPQVRSNLEPVHRLHHEHVRVREVMRELVQFGLAVGQQAGAAGKYFHQPGESAERLEPGPAAEDVAPRKQKHEARPRETLGHGVAEDDLPKVREQRRQARRLVSPGRQIGQLAQDRRRGRAHGGRRRQEPAGELDEQASRFGGLPAALRSDEHHRRVFSASSADVRAVIGNHGPEAPAAGSYLMPATSSTTLSGSSDRSGLPSIRRSVWTT